VHYLSGWRPDPLDWVRPNARGKPRRSAKHGGHPQEELVGVGLTNLLGWWQMFGLASPMLPC